MSPRPDAVTARSAFRLLREPLWARIALAVIGLSVAFVLLGRWQWHRHEARLSANTLVEANYAAAPVPIEQMLPSPRSTLAPTRLWTPVAVTGHYEPEHQVLIRNRPLNSVYGYEVVVPLRLASGAALLVDRGWLAAGQDFVRPDAVPAPPSGQVTVVARLRFGEGSDSRVPPAGQELRMDLGRIAALAGGPVYVGAYGQLDQERPAPPVAPTPLPKPDEDLGPHLSYAVQWWAGAIAAYVLLGHYALREVRGRGGVAVVVATTGPDAEAPGAPASGTPVPGATPVPDATPVPGTPRGRRLLPAAARSRRREPTDEEWEDAADTTP
ncbi:MAG TPA: SURF1 family protein [Kineosporiaceae bacterium]|nr:SURF1 family protein [Kineosporiaceae bacterium]